MTIKSMKQRDMLENRYGPDIKESSILNRRLVSFQMSKNIPFYRLFHFKEAFSPQMVEMFIKDYPKKSGKVLDPFSGSGTTLFSSRDMGFDSVGIELLPIGEFIFDTRKAAEKVDLNNLSNTVKTIKKLDFTKLPKSGAINFNQVPITKNAFTKETEDSIKGFIHYINFEVPDDNVSQILKFACFSILEKISYTIKSGQYLRWDRRAGKSKTKFQKSIIYPFNDALNEKLNDIIQDINNQRLFNPNNNKKASMELKRGSCLEIMPTLSPSSFDLVISSPPYCNRYDYTRTYALELVFLEAGEEKIKDLRQSMLSCTVENRNKKEYLKNLYNKDNFEEIEDVFYSVHALQEVLDILKVYRDEKKLNNSYIYRMVKNYFYEHCFAIFEFHRLLKDGGIVYYVNDNVRYAGEVVPVDLILTEIADNFGFGEMKILKLANGKGNSSQQMKTHGRTELRKSICYWKK